MSADAVRAQIEALLPAVLNSPLMLAAALLACLVTVGSIWVAFVERDPLPGRLKAIEARRSQLRSQALAARRRAGRTEEPGLMRKVVGHLKLLRSQAATAAQGKLLRAGWRSRDALVRFLFAKAISPIAAGGIAALLFYGLDLFHLSALGKLAGSTGFTLFGAYLPDLYVHNAFQKRSQALRLALPDGFDLLVICAEAGLSLDAALERVSREIAEAAPELADELGLTAVELSFLPERTKALENLAERVPLAGMRALINTLVQTERYGTPLSQSLRVLSAELRTERMMKAEEKAARLPVTLTLPMVLFIMPSLFIVLIGPAILRTIDALSRL
ncbi:tight adherence protein C [Tistlia consotensis]|uniref:Tight adherence protein C n=1 Tax=Tistlia consotensis USBA 355 TaxID=560819 RepID=A0A1Y6BI57_9PROT|nr:type II secretion system F family protein [Tistlia consotensis]SMF12522.1 tight adherence protein C [Tistlia consotensis USBA 355]SNR51032.1 tight adherence protein C [Tistlia consotensis]